MSDKQAMNKDKLKGWLVPADGECREIEIENTLKALQEVVGGYIETVTLYIDLVLIVNEEGRILGLPENEHLDGVVGDALVLGVDEDDFRSLTDGELAVLRRFLK